LSFSNHFSLLSIFFFLDSCQLSFLSGLLLNKCLSVNFFFDFGFEILFLLLLPSFLD
jgi:hypothetical protein